MAAHRYPVSIGPATFVRYGLGHLAGGALLGCLGAVLGSLVRSQLAAVIAVFVWSIILESLIGGLFTSIRPYLPYTAGDYPGRHRPGRGRVRPRARGQRRRPAAVRGRHRAAGRPGRGLAFVAARTTVRRDVA